MMKDLNLNHRRWKSFEIREIFEISTGKDLILGRLKEGKYPVVSHKAENNGISNYTEKLVGHRLFDPNTTLSLADRGTFKAHVQNERFYIGTRVKALTVKKTNVSKEILIFLCNAINNQYVIFSYARNACHRLPELNIMLPVNDSDEPDWAFMENYVKQKYLGKENDYKEYVTPIIEGLKYKDIPRLHDKRWKEFFVTELFSTIQRGKRLTKTNQIDGNIPYISSTSLNNGIDNFISNNVGVRIFSNCLSIANSGSVGSSFYQPYKFVASDHVTIMKNEKMNKFIYLFIATMTNRLTEKYNFNREINDSRISREKIMLPVTDYDEPDYDYMEQYVKNLMINKYKGYIGVEVT